MEGEDFGEFQCDAVALKVVEWLPNEDTVAAPSLPSRFPELALALLAGDASVFWPGTVNLDPRLGVPGTDGLQLMRFSVPKG